tara:strand:+ start:447 stop:671 length:225 start_codon:yes stop_codon:yes gene_type:complete
MSEIAIEFSGTIVADPYKLKFLNVEDDNAETINGVRWAKLPPSQREDYILDCGLYFRPSGETLKVWQELLEDSK